MVSVKTARRLRMLKGAPKARNLLVIVRIRAVFPKRSARTLR